MLGFCTLVAVIYLTDYGGCLILCSFDVSRCYNTCCCEYSAIFEFWTLNFLFHCYHFQWFILPIMVGVWLFVHLMLVAVTIHVVVNIWQSLNFLFHCYHCYIILVYDILYVQVVHLYKRKWVEETTYPHFTMIGQSLGLVYLSWEALYKFAPLYHFDTSGYAFTYPLAGMFGCKVICYTRYPTISWDMISRVRERYSMYNNDALIAQRFVS